MTTPSQRVAELRELAETGPDKVLRGNVQVAINMRAALREYADLIEQAEKGVTDEVCGLALAVIRRENGTILSGRYEVMEIPDVDDMRAALLAVAPHLALAGKEKGT